MTYWTETAIAHHLDGRFYQLQQKSFGTFAVVDLNEPEEVEEPVYSVTRWTPQELAYLMEMKRQGKTHAECAVALKRTEYAVMDKWQSRLVWGADIKKSQPKTSIWLDDIARVVCGVYGVRKVDFVSPRRAVTCVEARQVFYWLARYYTSFSYPQIGQFCGGRDHSTIIHGVNKIDEQMDRYRTKIELCVFDLGLTLNQEAA